MSENYGGKNYDDYFRILEENLEKSRISEIKKVQNSNTISKSQTITLHPKKRSKKNISPVVLLVCVLIIVVAIVPIIALSGAKDNSDGSISKKNTNSSIGNNQVTSTDKKEENIPAEVYTLTNKTTDILSSNDAKYAIIIDKRDNTIVAARNAKERAYPASTTKIMTLLTAAELITDFDDTFTMSLEITDPLFVEGASVAGYLNGEQVSMTDLLYGMILPSGADAAMGLAVKLAGSEEAFVQKMNEKVQELGLEDTHFDNVTGLHSENNYSTAYDMAVILDTALKNDLCKKILSTYRYTTASTEHHPEGILLSSTLFTYMYGTEPGTATILGGKTGFVNESGYCIASYGKNNKNGNEYIVVTLSNSARMPAFFGQIDLYKEFAK